MSTITTADLTASRALVSGSGGDRSFWSLQQSLGTLTEFPLRFKLKLNAKQATITGAATTIDDTDLTASRALVSSSGGKVEVSAITSTELAFLRRY